MANLKQRLRRKNANGSYDTIYLQADLSNVTGTLAIANGGTGSTSAADARSNLGITPANIGAAASSHTHSGYASSSHNHDSAYAAKGNVNVKVSSFNSTTATLNLVSV